MEATILENQMEKKMENEMETGISMFLPEPRTRKQTVHLKLSRDST